MTAKAHYRVLLSFAALALAGCGASHEKIDVVRLSGVLEEALPGSSYPLSLEMVEVQRDGRGVIHCVLENHSPEPITTDESLLPWETPELLDVNAVTPGGRVLRSGPLEKSLSNPPRLITIAPHSSVSGDFEVSSLPIMNLPRSDDLLLLWAYGVVNGNGPGGYRLNGTLVLRKK